MCRVEHLLKFSAQCRFGFGLKIIWKPFTLIEKLFKLNEKTLSFEILRYKIRSDSSTMFKVDLSEKTIEIVSILAEEYKKSFFRLEIPPQGDT